MQMKLKWMMLLVIVVFAVMSGCATEAPQGSDASAATIVPAESLRRVPPVYPKKAAKAGIDGWAVIRYSIDEQGRTRNLEVVETGGDSAFGRAAKEAVKKWRFEPARQDGTPIAVHGKETRLTFEINRSPAE